ncbi:MAG: PAS domain S-box protein [Spirochaetales bacterium]|nr:MAG: PAS domain S-box protein [Spirochaetales bacterium]
MPIKNQPSTADKWHSAIEAITESMSIISKDGIVLEINSAGCKALGLNRIDIIGKKCCELFHDQNPARPECPCERSLRTKAKETFEFLIDGKFSQVTVYPIPDEKGEVRELLHEIKDISERKMAEMALSESEYFFKESQRAAFIGSYKTDFVTGVWESSEVLNQIFGIDPDYSRSVQSWLEIVHPGDREMMDRYLREEVIAKRQPFNREYRIVRKSDGGIRWVHGLGEVTFDSEGIILSLYGTIQDITARKHTEEALKSSETRFRTMFSQAPIGIELFNSQGLLIDANKACLEMFGVNHFQQVKGFKLFEDPNVPADAKKRLLLGESVRFETLFDFELIKKLALYATTKSGQCYLECFITRWDVGFEDQNGYLVHVSNITERKKAENALKSLVQQKEFLMKELQHRVKNNLNLVKDFLSLETSKISEEKSRRVLEEAQDRIHSVASVYDQLYKSDDFGSVDLQLYIQHLADSLFKTYAFDTDRIRLSASLQGVRLNHERAIILGLILNELLTNCLKYAFPDGKKGIIGVDLKETEDMVILVITDDGIGLPKGLNVETPDSFGLLVVKMLTAQLSGTVEIAGGNGTVIKIAFSK